ncbi:MAG: hypothetical protein DHS20C15_18650 [Planctomycetota bacterium]|nr:MAG: hypothetical protein DHS20C15_18650 [Planctomycetota bacterium]
MRAPAWCLAGVLFFAAAAHTQDSESEAESLRARLSAAGALDADGLPRPEFWSHNPDAAARDWLNKPHIDADDLARRPEAYAEVLAEHGLLLDMQSRSLSLRGAMRHDETTLQYPIEYLVVTETGSVHEAAVLVRAQPSVINACLRALGSQPGRSTLTRLKDPAPPVEAVAAGEVSKFEVLPGHGPLVDINVSWLDDAGRAHLESLESLLIDMRTGDALQPLGWIHTGSGMASIRQGSGRANWYEADLNGDVIAIYLADARVCVLERHSLDGLDDTFYTLNPARSPRQGTPVTLVIRVRDEIVPEREAIDVLELIGRAELDEAGRGSRAVGDGER